MSRCLSGLSRRFYEVRPSHLLAFMAFGGVLMLKCTDDAKMPIHLLIYAVQTAVTTATCIADYLSWSGFNNAQKIELGKLYVPYLALCMCAFLFHRVVTIKMETTIRTDLVTAVFMGVDMYSRLDAALSQRAGARDRKVK